METLALLTESPGRIAAATRELEHVALHAQPEPGAWSINDILAHLRACADVWGGTIESMLSEQDPALPEIHPRQWIKRTDYREQSFQDSFRSYFEQRGQLLNTLKGLAFDDWSRGALIGGRRHTVFSQARRLAKHEDEHCRQIEEMLHPK